MPDRPLMTPLDEIEARLAKATPGPWTRGPQMAVHTLKLTQPDGYPYPLPTHIASLYERDDGDQAFPDADLIAHAPSDLAALLKVARAAEPFAQCYAPIVDENTKTTVGPCGHCSGCKLAFAIEPLAEVLSARAETEAGHG